MPKLELKAGIRHRFELSFELNERVEYAYVREFIVDALESWGGQKHPNDPLFGSLEEVKIKRIRDTNKIKSAMLATIIAISLMPTAYASDRLKQPAAYQPTVEAEIARGKSASLRCAGELDWLSYAVCIDRVSSREQTPSDAFKLGLNWSATKGLNLRRRTAEPPWLTQDPIAFARAKTDYHTKWRSLQAKIGLSFEEVESVR